MYFDDETNMLISCALDNYIQILQLPIYLPSERMRTESDLHNTTLFSEETKK